MTKMLCFDSFYPLLTSRTYLAESGVVDLPGVQGQNRFSENFDATMPEVELARIQLPFTTP